MILDMTGVRPVLRHGAVNYLLIVCAVVGAVTLYLLATASATNPCQRVAAWMICIGVRRMSSANTCIS